MIDMLSVIYNDVAEIMRKWKKDDIYAISFFAYDRDDKPGEPTLTVGYNTMERALSDYSLGASSPEEAKWNYAFWLQNQEYLFGYDNVSAQLIKDWIADSSLPNNEGAITEAFAGVLVDVSLKLHNDGVIADLFGKEIPIIIHELEYYDAIAQQNKKANPSGTISEFLQWMEDEMLNPRPAHEMNVLGFDDPQFNLWEYFENENKILEARIRKMAQEGKIPADRWQEYKSKFPNEK